MLKKTVVIGFLGTQLDSGQGAGRWEKWRPTVSLVQHEDTVVHRLELIYTPRHEALAQGVKRDIASVSPETEVRLVAMDIADPWDFGEMYGALYDWVRSYTFKPDTEQYWTHITTGTHVAQICMFLMVESRFIPGVLLQTAPPKKQTRAQPGTFALIDLDLSRYDVLAQRFEQEQRDALDFLKSGIPTRNKGFNALIEEIERVAVRSKAPILLTGPTGAGKSHLARRMFELKKSRHQVKGEFVEVNCATLHGDGAASTLFGHRKGAFTGAAADRAGLLRTAHEGVLFLDEIGELGADEQAMLLKAIEEKRFYPLGADKEVTSDFQLIAGTNRDLRQAVREGRFRDDLLARLSLWTFQLPALRDRPEDLAPNLDYELDRVAADRGSLVSMSKSARDAFLGFAHGGAWPGNFRDLGAAVRRMATLADGGRIADGDVAAETSRLRAAWSGGVGADPLAALLGERAAALDRFDRVQLADVITVCASTTSLSAAGRVLFARSRQDKTSRNDADRLRKYLARFELTFDAIRAGAAQ